MGNLNRPSPPREDDEDDLACKTKAQLKHICGNIGLPTDGSAMALRERVGNYRKEASAPAPVRLDAAPLALDELELVLRRDFILFALLRGNDYLPPLISKYDPADLWPQYLRWRRAKSPASGLVYLEGKGSSEDAE